jgi:hypothetical protein
VHEFVLNKPKNIGKSHVHSNKNNGILVQVNKPKNIGKSHVHSNKNNGILVQVNKPKNIEKSHYIYIYTSVMREFSP